MKRRTLGGVLVVILLSFIPIIPWFLLGPAQTYVWDYANITHFLGQITGLVGMTMFALTFVLSTRLKFLEKLFGGQDQIYVIHSIVGSLSFILILAHPILLVLKHIPERLDLAAKYLLPGHGISVDFGIIALSGIIILILATLYMKIKYHYWKMSHKLFGLFFILAVFHTVLVRGVASRDNIFDGYYIYVGIVSAIGIIAFIYTLIFKNVNDKMYKVSSISKISSNIFDIRMLPLKRQINYNSGQFAFFKFYDKAVGRESHPYSIASPTNDSELRIIVKNLGDYTSKLNNLRVKTPVSVEGPFGRFISKTNFNQIWLAAGIGITPFIGMAKDLQKSTGRATLYYTVRDPSEFVAIGEFRKIESSTKGRFKIILWDSSKKGYLKLKDVDLTEFKTSKFYICGPHGFKESFRKGLMKRGVSNGDIFEEEFRFK